MVNRIKIERYLLAISGLAVLLVLLLPSFVRLLYHNNLLIGEQAYYHLRISDGIIEKGFFFDYDKILGMGAYEINAYDLMLSSLGLFTGTKAASLLLPIILGVSSFVIFSVLLRYFGMMQEKRAIVLSVLAMTPAFIYTFSASSKESAAIFLMLLAVYFALRQNMAYKIMGLALFIIASTFGLFQAVLITLILFLYFIHDMKRNSASLWAAMIVLLFAVFYAPENIYYSEGIVKGTISDLGAISGFGIFNMILAFLGVIYVWRRKKHYLFVYFMLIFMLVSIPVFGNTVNPYLAFVAAVLGGLGFSFVIERHWELGLIKRLAVLIIIGGLALSAISFINRLALSEPSNEIMESLKSLSKLEKGTVLSHYSNGFWIEYFAGMKVLEDGIRRNNISEELFYTRNLNSARRIMKDYSIKYIWIDDRMKHGEVWNKEGEGMLFLFRNNETFKSIYSSNNIEIWKVANVSEQLPN